MTRINLVPVQDLADQHLFAEWREIKRIPIFLKKSLKANSAESIHLRIPNKFTLNTGHVLFFLDKMIFLHDRYVKLTEELINRNYNIAGFNPAEIFLNVPDSFKEKEWQPDNIDIKISIERISIKLKNKLNWYRYYGNIMKTEYFIELYKLLLVDNEIYS
jgi:deoxyribonuclease (pyrimidine dimer)